MTAIQLSDICVKRKLNYTYDEYTNKLCQKPLKVFRFEFDDGNNNNFNKYAINWTEQCTVRWFMKTIMEIGLFDREIPFYNYKYKGKDLCNMEKEEFILRLSSKTKMDVFGEVNLDQLKCDLEKIYEKLQIKINSDKVEVNNILDLPAGLIEHLDTEQDSSNEILSKDSVSLDSSSFGEAMSSDSDVSSPLDDFKAGFSSVESTSSSNESDSGFSDFKPCKKLRVSNRGQGRPKGSKNKGPERPKGLGRPRGRPKGSIKKPKDSLFIPEFLRDLLLDKKFCPSYIRWTNYETKTFLLVNTKAICEQWQQRKAAATSLARKGSEDHCNRRLTDYRHFSRAMRYHYNSTMKLKRPENKTSKLFQFGDDFEIPFVENPNFVNPC